MFKYRAVSFPLLLGILSLTIFWMPWGKYLFAGIGTIAMFLLGLEFFAMLDKTGMKSFRKTGSVLLGLLFFGFSCLSGIAGRRLNGCGGIIFLAALLLPFLCWAALLFVKDKRDFLSRIPVTAGGIVVLGITFLPLLMIYSTRWYGIYVGNAHFLFFVLVTKSMDTGGYIAGMLTGKYLPGGNHKIVPSISPKKSWEGTLGGVIFSILVALILYWCGRQPPGMNLWTTVLLGAVLALGSFAGDLTESAIKRAADIKDSANYIPGMGGVFDVLDSFIYNGMLFLVFCRNFQ